MNNFLPTIISDRTDSSFAQTVKFIYTHPLKEWEVETG